MVKKIVLLGSIALVMCVSSARAGEHITKRLYIPVAKNLTLQKSGDGDTLMVKDYLNSTREMIDLSGNVANVSDYYPYGNTLDPSPQVNMVRDDTKENDKLFTSHRKLEDLSIYHAGARFYSPTSAQFIQADIVEGPNRYAYVGGNPISFTDPSGNDGDDSSGDYACEKVDWKCRRTVLNTLAKVHGAMAYSEAKGWNMTSAALRHYIYGEGEPMDISQLYADAILGDSVENKAQAIKNYVSEVSDDYSLSMGHYEAFAYKLNGQNITQPTLMAAECSSTIFKFTGRGVISPDDYHGRNFSPDIKNSMFRHTIKFEGDVIDISRSEYDSGWLLELQNPRIQLYDVYDWDKYSPANAGMKLGEFLPYAMMKRIHSWGNRGDAFLGIDLSINDRDMATLMDSRIGIGLPFEMHGTLNVGDRFSFQIPEQYFTQD